MTARHRVPLPPGAHLMTEVGQRVEPVEPLATHRPPGEPIAVPVAGPLRLRGPEGRGALAVEPGAIVGDGQVLARASGREVRAPAAGLLLAYDETGGSAILAPHGAAEPVMGHVRGQVIAIDEAGIDLRVPAAVLQGVGGSGSAVHGELLIAVHAPDDELRATAVDVGAAAKIVVGGSRASAETLTRARAMGVAGIVLGGILDKELRDFEAIGRRRREAGGPADSLSVLLIEGYGKVGLDPRLFAWFRRHEGHMASLFGSEGRLFVYDASPPPSRRPHPRPGDGVIAHRRPFAGRAGRLLRILDGLHATPSGIACQMGVVRFDDGRTAAVPIANLEATSPDPA